MSNLPALAGKLAINFMDKFHVEKSVHCTDQYLSQLKAQRAVLKKNHACCFCGFPDGRFLELHHVNGNHADWSSGNIKLICTLCHRLQHLGWVGVANLGKIIYLPSLIDHKKQRFWLEPFHHIQRFYLMQDYLSADERNRLSAMPLTRNIAEMVSLLKTQDVDAKYLDDKEERAKYLADVERINAADENEKPKVILAVKEDRQKRLKELEEKGTGNDFADLHVLDLLSILQESGKKDAFLKQQAEGEFGRMSILFNNSVFEPFEPNPDYSLRERMEYYRKLNYFSASGLQKVMHTLRQQAMGKQNGN